MSQKKIHPSEDELRASVLNSIGDILTLPNAEDIAVGDWVTSLQISKHLGISYDAADHRLRRKVRSGHMETKLVKCKQNGRVTQTAFYRIKK